jgi:hypothetical protein
MTLPLVGPLLDNKNSYFYSYYNPIKRLNLKLAINTHWISLFFGKHCKVYIFRKSFYFFLFIEMCICLRFLYTMYEYFNNYVITKCLLSFNANWITPIYCAISIKILNWIIGQVINNKHIITKIHPYKATMFWMP